MKKQEEKNCDQKKMSRQKNVFFSSIFKKNLTKKILKKILLKKKILKKIYILKKKILKKCQKFTFWENQKLMLCCTTTIPRLSQIKIWVKSDKILKVAKNWFLKNKITKNSIFKTFLKKSVTLHIYKIYCKSTQNVVILRSLVLWDVVFTIFFFLILNYFFKNSIFEKIKNLRYVAQLQYLDYLRKNFELAATSTFWDIVFTSKRNDRRTDGRTHTPQNYISHGG